MSNYRFFISSMLLCVWLAVIACSPGIKDAYPTPENTDLAPLQRQEFVSAFLRGRWCDARYLFNASVENYLMQDNFCAISANFSLAFRMKKYIGITDKSLLEKANAFQKLAGSCPQSGLSNSSGQLAPVKKDNLYAPLLEKKDWDKLLQTLKNEKDPLFKSVYARKAARQCADYGQTKKAIKLIYLARDTDASKGWVVFLVEDWKMIAAFSSEKELQNRAKKRSEYLQTLIQPCGSDFSDSAGNMSQREAE